MNPPLKLAFCEGGKLMVTRDPRAGFQPLHVQAEDLTELEGRSQEQAQDWDAFLTSAVVEGEALAMSAMRPKLPVASEVWIAEPSPSETTLLFGDRAPRSPFPWVLKAPRGTVAGISDPLGLRPDAIWHVPLPGLAVWISPEGVVRGYGLGLDVTALDRLADSVTAAKVFYHSMALCPILALADQSVNETMSGRLVVVRHERPVFSGEVLLTWSLESVQHEVAKLRQAWPLRGWTTLVIPGQIVWDEAFALEDEDQISFEVESLGHMTHTARILHPSWASVVPAHGQPVVKVHERDNVAVVLSPLRAGDWLRLQGQEIVARQAIPFGHKIALTEIAKDAPVIKYGEIIGQAGQPIHPGEHVHVHNFDSRRGRGDLEKPVPQTAK